MTFCEVGEDDIFYVDDWDRSPAAVTERLTYKCVSFYTSNSTAVLIHALNFTSSRDVYELKELRIALPRIQLAKRNS